MTDLNKQIHDRVEAFVADLSDLVRQAALESVREALGGAAAPASKPRRKAPGRKKATTRRKAAGKRVRRSTGDVGATGAQILAFVKSNAGCSVGNIGEALGKTTRDLSLPIKQLVNDGQLRTTGQRRGTRYHAGKGGSAAKKTGPSRKKATRKKARRTTRKTA